MRKSVRMEWPGIGGSLLALAVIGILGCRRADDQLLIITIADGTAECVDAAGQRYGRVIDSGDFKRMVRDSGATRIEARMDVVTDRNKDVAFGIVQMLEGYQDELGYSYDVPEWWLEEPGW